MKKTIKYLLMLAGCLALESCSLFPLPFTPEEIQDEYKGRPAWWYVLPAEGTWLVNGVTTSIASRFAGGEFGTNELNAFVAENSCDSLPGFPGRTSIVTNGRAWPAVPTGGFPWAVGTDGYPDKLDYVYYCWSQNFSTVQADGADYNGWFSDVPAQNGGYRNQSLQLYNIGVVMLEAGYIEEAVVAFYRCLQLNARFYHLAGRNTPCTIYSGGGDSCWITGEVAYANLIRISGQYGKQLGIKYVDHNFQAIGDVSPLTWIAHDYDIKIGRFIPWTD